MTEPLASGREDDLSRIPVVPRPVSIDDVNEDPTVSLNDPIRTALGTGSERTALLVIDRKSLTRDCLVAALTEHPLLSEITSASDPEEAVARLGRRIDINTALLNLGSDPFDEETLTGLRARLLALLPTGRIAIMSDHDDGPHILAALRAGIAGYLASDTPLNVVAGALHLISLGWSVFPRLDPATFGVLPGTLSEEKTLAELRLSVRQRQVLWALQHGMTNRSIGIQLGISERAIKAHVQELMRRLKVKNRTQIVAKLAGLGRPPGEE